MSLSEGMTPADIAAVTGNNNNEWGGNGAWWIIILFIFAICGWGGNGFGSGGGAADNYVLASDFATLQRQLSDGFGGVEQGIDTIRNGLCDGFYTEAQLVNGVNTNIANLGYQMQDCCCQTQRAIDGVRYDNATNTCAITNAINNSTRDIIDNQNANARAILDAQTAAAIEAKNEKIAEQNQMIFQYQLQASQAAQNNYLISQLRPAPVPAFNVPAPYQYGQGCGCNGCF